MKGILESIVSGGAAASLIVLVLAIIHETAFYLIIGNQFQSLMSPTDYLLSALNWLSIVILSILIGYVIPVPYQKKLNSLLAKQALSNEDIMVAKGYVKKVDWAIRAAFGIALIFLILTLFFLDFARGIWIPACLFLYVTGVPIFGPRFGLQFTEKAFLLLMVLPVLVGDAVWYGMKEGFNALEQTGQTYVFHLKGEATEHNWPIVRNLERGVLVHDVVENRLSFYKWDDISIMSERAFVPSWGAPICYFASARGCKQPSATP